MFSLAFCTLLSLSIFAAPEKPSSDNPPTSMKKKLLHKTALLSAGAMYSTSLGVMGLGALQTLDGIIENEVGSCLLGLSICTLGYCLVSHLPEAILHLEAKYISKNRYMSKSDAGFFGAGFLAPITGIYYLLNRESSVVVDLNGDYA